MVYNSKILLRMCETQQAYCLTGKFSTRKCEVIDLTNCCSTIIYTYIENALQVKVSDLTLLGAPLGNQAMKSVLEKISELSAMGSRLSWVSSHHAFFLLKKYFALLKLLYVLRTSPCFDHPLL